LKLGLRVAIALFLSIAVSYLAVIAVLWGQGRCEIAKGLDVGTKIMWMR